MTAFVRFLVSAISAFFLSVSFFSLTSSAGLSSDEDSTSEAEDAFFALVVAAFFFSGVATLDKNIKTILVQGFKMFNVAVKMIYFGTLGAFPAIAFLALTGEGLGFGAFTTFVTTVVSLATVLAARLAFGGGGASSSDSDVFFALLLEAAGAAFGAALATFGAAFFAAFGLAGSVAGTSLVGFTAFSVTSFFTGLWFGLAATLAFLGAAFGFAAGFAFAAGLAASTGFSSTSATLKSQISKYTFLKKITCQQHIHSKFPINIQDKFILNSWFLKKQKPVVKFVFPKGCRSFAMLTVS